MSDEDFDLQQLRIARTDITWDVVMTLAAGVSLFLLFERAILLVARPESIALVGIAGVAFSVAGIRAIVETASALERPCPRCHESFFGGIGKAFASLPQPGKACAHCGVSLETEAAKAPRAAPQPR